MSHAHADVMSMTEWKATGCPGTQPVSMTLDAVAPPRQPYVALRLAALPDEAVDAYRGRLSGLVKAGKLAPGKAGIAIEARGMSYAGRTWARAGTLGEGGEGGEATIVCSVGGERGAELRREAAEALGRAGWSVTLDGRHQPARGDRLYVLEGPLQGHRVEVLGAPFAGLVGVRGGEGVGTAQVTVAHLVERRVERTRPVTRLTRRATPLDAAVADIMRRGLGSGWAVERKPGGAAAVVKRGPGGAEQQRIETWDPDDGAERQIRRTRGW